MSLQPREFPTPEIMTLRIHLDDVHTRALGAWHNNDREALEHAKRVWRDWRDAGRPRLVLLADDTGNAVWTSDRGFIGPHAQANHDQWGAPDDPIAIATPTNHHRESVKGKRGRTVHLESFWEPCRDKDGNTVYHACVIRWRDWESSQVEVFGEWSEEHSTNIHSRGAIRQFFRNRDFGARPLAALDRILSTVPAERMTTPPQPATA